MSDFLDQFDKVPLSQKLLLLVLLMLGIFVAYFFMFQSKIEESIQRAESRVSELSTQRAELHAGADEITHIQEEIVQLCARQETFLEKLPPREEVHSLLQTIAQQARLTGLVVKVFERSTNVPGPNYTTIPVQMKFEGSYDQVSDFFYFIGRQQRIVNVSDISLNVQPGGATWRLTEGTPNANELDWFNAGRVEVGPPSLIVECTLRTYFADASATRGGTACQ